MKKNLALCVFGLMFLLPGNSHAHTNTVGQLTLENFKNELYITASMDKRFLTLALMNEGDCSPKEMLSKCGDEYLKDHIQLIINGDGECLTFSAFNVQKDYVTFNYVVVIDEKNIEYIDLQSDYMLDYHEHSVLKVSINVKGHNKSYNMKSSRQKININL